MGMSMPIYYFTWFIRYFASFLVIHAVGSVVISSTLPHVSFIIPFVVFLLFDMVIMIQSFFIQTFFTRSKIGIVIALLFFLLQFIVSVVNSDSDARINTLISIVPHCAFILSFQTMIYAESIKTDINFTDTLNNYSIMTCVISCILNCIFWLALTWYLQQVFPNEFGTKKHPFFCCIDQSNKVIPGYNQSGETASATLNESSITLNHKSKHKPDV